MRRLQRACIQGQRLRKRRNSVKRSHKRRSPERVYKRMRRPDRDETSRRRRPSPARSSHCRNS